MYCEDVWTSSRVDHSDSMVTKMLEMLIANVKDCSSFLAGEAIVNPVSPCSFL